MAEFEEAKELLSQQRYKEAATFLDRSISDNKNDGDFWYLRGIVSLKLKNYDGAHDCFDRALLLSKKAKYYQIKGMAHFEIFEIEEALEAFLSALELESDNATTNFFLSLCYLFLDDPRSDIYIKKAIKIDTKKTRQLLMNFYTLFLKNEPKLSQAQKAMIEEKIHGLRNG